MNVLYLLLLMLAGAIFGSGLADWFLANLHKDIFLKHDTKMVGMMKMFAGTMLIMIAIAFNHIAQAVAH